MSIRFVVGIAAVTLSACTAGTHLCPQPTSAAVPRSSTLIVYHSGTSEPILQMAQQRGATVIYDLRQVDAVALRLKNGANVDEEIQYYKQLEGVEMVTRGGVNHVYRPD